MGVGVALSVWWNLLLVQNDRILETLAHAVQAAEQERKAPLALLMFLGILCFVVLLLGLVYFFLRLIQTLRSNQAQKQFIAAVSHELRSPVASLQLLFDTIQQSNLDSAKRKEFEAYMQKDLLRLRTTVDRVLDTARVENAHLFSRKESKEKLSLRELIEKCLEEIRHLVEPLNEGKIELTTDSNKETYTVRANRLMLESAFRNILDNALKYSHKTPHIKVRLKLEGKNKIRVEIEDDGIGMTKEEQKKVFSRFYRTTRSEGTMRPGTGLGLYFVKLAISSQSGKIWVESRGPNMGSIVFVELPLSTE